MNLENFVICVLFGKCNRMQRSGSVDSSVNSRINCRSNIFRPPSPMQDTGVPVYQIGLIGTCESSLGFMFLSIRDDKLSVETQNCTSRSNYIPSSIHSYTCTLKRRTGLTGRHVLNYEALHKRNDPMITIRIRMLVIESLYKSKINTVKISVLSCGVPKRKKMIMIRRFSECNIYYKSTLFIS